MPYIERNDGRGPDHAIFVTVLRLPQRTHMQGNGSEQMRGFLTSEILLQVRASSCLSRGITEKTGKQACKS